jgi:DNA-binding beta-propeller fold protein YncE
VLRAFRVAVVAVVAAVVVGSACARDAAGPIAGARALKVCAGAGPFWPTMTLALRGNYAWVACNEQSRVVRVNTRRGKAVKSVRLGGPVIAVASGYSSVWALESGGTLYRLGASTGKVLQRIATHAVAAYNIWIGGGSVWVADDQGAAVIRISPSTNRVVARVAAGDGPADMAFSGGSAWVINHRDRTLTRVDLATNSPIRLGDVGGGAPERMVWSQGSLWITGRGTKLLQVDGADGSVDRTIGIGVSGIDIAAAGDDLWVPTRSAAIDPRGFPRMTALVRVSATTGSMTVVAKARSRVDVHGLAADRAGVWIADNTQGRLYRVPRRR